MKALIIFCLILLVILLIGIGPLITIWSLNTVFGLAIAYNIWTWLGTLWLCSFFAAFRKIKKA